MCFDSASADPFNIPLEWLGGDFRSEYWTVDTTLESGRYGHWHYRRTPTLGFAALHIDDSTGDNGELEQIARMAYVELGALRAALGLAYPARIWHWLSEPTAGHGEAQRYRQTCRGRAEGIAAMRPAWPTLPPATLVASARSGLRMHALLSDSPIRPIENPRQVSAYRYPARYAARAPAFARAAVARLAARPYLLISGTASIIGHESRHIGDLDAQIDETSNNIAAVIDAAAPATQGKTVRDLQYIRAYLRHREHVETVERRVRARYGNVPLAVLHAPLCRDDLLVEFETQMALDQETIGLSGP